MVAYHIVADLVVAIHAAYVGFVVIGFAAIVAGAALGWKFIANFWFRAAHLAAIGLVAVESICGAACPLTTIESALRSKAGESSYRGEFVGYWAHRMIFYDAPSWEFTTAYLAFALAVAAMFIVAPPRWPSYRRARSSSALS